MKQKEEVAEKWVHDPENRIPWGIDALDGTRAYLAGWEAAREACAIAILPEIRSMISRSQAAEIIRNTGEEEA